MQDLTGGLDLGPILFGVVAAAFILLLLLVIRRMASGGLHRSIDEPSQDRLPSPEEEDDQAPDDLDDDEDLDEEGEAPGDDEPTEDDGPDDDEPQPETETAAMRRGLAKTRSGFMSRLNGLLFGRTLDPELIDELEELLVTSDIGIHTTERLLGDLRGELSRKEIADAKAVQSRLRAKVREILEVDRSPLPTEHGPSVIMVIGVNGVGKTTTIGKLAARLTAEGKKVVLAAGDTFRAAAVEQLEIWAERSGSEIVRGADNADPSSVIFDAIKKAQSVGADVCIADTAGRLHTKVNLMEELKKVRRVMDKAMPGAPHEVMLVLDATTGQNAIAQAKQFTAAVQVSSLALTKLDGTAKGGVVVAVCDALELPVRLIGVGEGVDDLRDFDPEAFVEALFTEEEDAATR